MAIGQRQRIAVPIFGRVRLSRLDQDARVEMLRAIDGPTMAASNVVGFSHGAPMARLVESLAQQTVDGRAAKGVEISSLSNSGHIREGFTDEFGEVVDLAVRSLLPMYGQRAIHEYVTSIPVVGKEMNGIGADQNPKARRVAHILLAGVGGKDRTLFHQARFLRRGRPVTTPPRVLTPRRSSSGVLNSVARGWRVQFTSSSGRFLPQRPRP